MPGNWKVYSISGKTMYTVGRIKDTTKAMHSGNIEYAPDFNYTDDKLYAEDCAYELNVLSGNPTSGIRPWGGNTCS